MGGEKRSNTDWFKPINPRASWWRDAREPYVDTLSLRFLAGTLPETSLYNKSKYLHIKYCLYSNYFQRESVMWAPSPSN